jgi:spore maturation protein CgeB
MVAAGWSPSVRLFEAASCGTPIISDRWNGIEAILEPDREILLGDGPDQVVAILRAEEGRAAIGQAGRKRVLGAHTAAHRAGELEAYLAEVNAARSRSGGAVAALG